MYWTVIGAFVAFEYMAEWLISWSVPSVLSLGFPYLIQYNIQGFRSIGRLRLLFYFSLLSLKHRSVLTAHLLFSSLNNILLCQGSTYIYKSYLQPFFTKNETELDAGIVTVQRNVFLFLKARFSRLWEIIVAMLNKLPASGQASQSGVPQPSPALPSLESVTGLWKAYAPTLLSALQPKPVPPPSDSPPTASTSSFQATGDSVSERTPPHDSAPL